MNYANMVSGTFLARPNRFIAHVDIAGQTETVHVKNTGRCKELLVPRNAGLVSGGVLPCQKNPL